MSIDIHAVRADTRGCESSIHFNSAGASLMPIPVADCQIGWLREEEFRGGYETVERRDHELQNFYEAGARLLNCAPSSIAFVENATRAWDMAFYSLSLGPGDKILTTVAEYGSNMIAYLHRARKTGCQIQIVPNDDHGQIDVDALERMIDGDTKLISISHIPTGDSVVNPAEAVGAVARRHGIPYLLDACQSAGQVPLDTSRLNCDFLSATGRKYLRGPRATGLLYVAPQWLDKLDPVLLDQHAADLVSETQYVVRADAKRFENWECNFAGKAALGVAMDYASNLGLEHIQTRVFKLAEQLRDALRTIDGVTLTDQGLHKCGIVTWYKSSITPDDFKRLAATRGINVSVSSGSGSRVSFDRRGIEAVVRSSVHYFNTEQEIERFAELVSGT